LLPVNDAGRDSAHSRGAASRLGITSITHRAAL
jgi:hypothetical protein